MRILDTNTRWQHMAEADGEDTWADEYRYQRQLAVIDFLADPGYSTAEGIMAVQRFAPDVFPEARCRQFFADIWPRHLAMLKGETLAHSFAIGCPLLGWGLAKVGMWQPAAVFLGLCLLVLCAEYVWAAASMVFRRAFVMRTGWTGIDTGLERYCLSKGVSWWRRPVVWLVFPIVLRWRRRHARPVAQVS